MGLRTFFTDRGFLEVTTPVWSQDVVVDRHLDPVPVLLAMNSAHCLHGYCGYLQTSPEQHMKRLLAAGARAIYQVSPVFRGGERGTLHNPEFTMAEWYRTGDDLQAGMNLLADLVAALLKKRPPCEMLTYREAFLRHARVDPHLADAGELTEWVRQFADWQLSEFAGQSDRDLLLDVIFAHQVQGQLGRSAPQIVYYYPASQAALAQVSRTAEGYAVAERFELFVDGVELANGYHELTDPHELQRRTEAANRQRQTAGKAALIGPRRLITAMQAGLPPCAGAALGFDRLVMVAVGAATIDQVLTFPYERA
jgi:lysyl-tRNA synthetase class 2